MNETDIRRPAGKFIAFEGIDGAGKTTQIKLLTKKLAALGVRCYETREPTDSPIGSLIHQIMTAGFPPTTRLSQAYLSPTVSTICSIPPTASVKKLTAALV